MCFSDGQAVPVADVNFSSSVKQEGGELNAYIIEFMLDEEKKTPTFIKRPVFKIKVGASNAIDVDLGGDLEFKKSYSYTIVSNVKIVEKEHRLTNSSPKLQNKEEEADFLLPPMLIRMPVAMKTALWINEVNWKLNWGR